MVTEDIIFHGTLVAFSTIFSYSVTHLVIPLVGSHFKEHTNLRGINMGSRDQSILPESLGIVAGAVYLISFLLFSIVMPYLLVLMNIITNFSLSDKLCISTYSDGINGYSNSLSNFAAITSIFAMLMLGFIDDCYDLRWRCKLLFPFAASIPLLSVYYYSYGDRTTILIPRIIAQHLDVEENLNIGLFYYIYMLMFVIFCTNAINIYAGINGLEVGQTIVLTLSVILYNLVEVTTKSDCDEVHILSLQLLLPFLFCSYALYKFNRFPARVFVGDSYCYFAGMTLAVVGILGHFSEEILIFAVPQIFNFILSVPQLFKLVPCPRHRLPKYNTDTGLREPSTFNFKYSELNIVGRMIMRIFSALNFAHIEKENKIEDGETSNNTSSDSYTSNNFTLINLWLCWFGPKDERTLCHQLLRLQCSLSFLALAILTFTKMEHDH